jgi:hypothetical protein
MTFIVILSPDKIYEISYIYATERIIP